MFESIHPFLHQPRKAVQRDSAFTVTARHSQHTGPPSLLSPGFVHVCVCLLFETIAAYYDIKSMDPWLIAESESSKALAFTAGELSNLHRGVAQFEIL